MGVQVLPSFENRPARYGLHLVEEPASSAADVERFSLETPRYASEDLNEGRDPLGAMRGIAIALGIQAAVAVLLFGLWKLHVFLR
jgi:hypothetical protein